MKELASLFLISFIFSSCSSLEQSIDQLYKEVRASSQYIVKENETLWSIAIKNNTSASKIAIKNNLEKPYVIYPGQKLNLTNLELISTKEIDVKSINWILPTKSTIKRNRDGNFWFIFNGKVGDPIYASRKGKVVLSGPVLPGYGNFIMLDHGDDLFIAKGEEVSSGQQIATIGSSEIDKPTLKFQIRKSGVPIKISDIEFN